MRKFRWFSNPGLLRWMVLFCVSVSGERISWKPLRVLCCLLTKRSRLSALDWCWTVYSFLSLSIQSLKARRVCVCALLLRQNRFKAPCTSKTESRLLRHKAQPPHPLLSSSSSSLNRIRLLIYSGNAAQRGGQNRGRLLRRTDFGAPQLRAVEVDWDKGARRVPLKEEFSSTWDFMHGYRSLKQGWFHFSFSLT